MAEFIPADMWVSVKDRLPKMEPIQDHPDVSASERVLVLIDFGYCTKHIHESAYCGGKWMFLMPGESDLVTHWMPYPELPNGKRKHEH